MLFVNISVGGVLTSAVSTDLCFGDDDVIRTGSGNDLIVGGVGNDLIDAGEGVNIVLGDNGLVTYTSKGVLVSIQAVDPAVGPRKTALSWCHSILTPFCFFLTQRTLI